MVLTPVVAALLGAAVLLNPSAAPAAAGSAAPAAAEAVSGGIPKVDRDLPTSECFGRTTRGGGYLRVSWYDPGARNQVGQSISESTPTLSWPGARHKRVDFRYQQGRSVYIVRAGAMPVMYIPVRKTKVGTVTVFTATYASGHKASCKLRTWGQMYYI